MIEPTSGRIWIDDQDTAAMDAAQLRRGIGYVIQHAGLFPHRTIVDNVAHRAAAARLGQGARPAARAMELLERVGLPTELRRPLPRPALRRPAAARRASPARSPPTRR